MRSECNSLEQRAPAKINLYLAVLGRRPDGYHDIESLMCPVGLFDAITARVAGAGISLEISDHELPADSRNLAYRAVQLLMDAGAAVPGVSLHLKKRIPVAAGLGGGSADAAVVLSMVNELAAAGFSEADLMQIGARLGSDVPFFFLNGPAWAGGRGEVLSPLAISPQFWVVLVKPGFSVSTAWAYGQWPSGRERAARPVPRVVDLLSEGPSLLRNDLEEVVIPRHREIALIKEALNQRGAWGALMSGSGPAVFGVFFEEKVALEARDSLRADYRSRGWFIEHVPALV